MARDVFGAPGSDAGDRQLAECARRFEDYSERVLAHLHAVGTDSGGAQP
ncbi:Chromate resistance protein ChrB [Streptomyces sp. NPDC002205]